VAEAFARAWASWRKVSEHLAPQAWMVRTALNTGISRWRAVATRSPFSMLGRWRACRWSFRRQSSIDPLIMVALMRLPAGQRQVIGLRLFLDLDAARAAEVLGMAPGTVQAHLGRAIASLCEDLSWKP
jgi:DNA-directed RNA polymerase specialized sigma24 family protein